MAGAERLEADGWSWFSSGVFWLISHGLGRLAATSLQAVVARTVRGMVLRLKRWAVWVLATVVLEAVAEVGTRLVTGQWVVGWPFDVAALLGGYFLARRVYPLLPPDRGDGRALAKG